MGKYTEEELAKMFERPTRATVPKNKPKYDVRVTLNGNGRFIPKVRFGLRDHGSEIMGQYNFVEVSNIEITKSRIYFRMHSEKAGRGFRFHKIHKSSKTETKEKTDGCYFTITPPSGKRYRAYTSGDWIGRTFPLLFDEENGLYYIENDATVATSGGSSC